MNIDTGVTRILLICIMRLTNSNFISDTQHCIFILMCMRFPVIRWDM